MPSLKSVFTLPTKSQWIEIGRRVVVTFGSAFSASLAANEAGITNLHTAELVAVAAGAAGINAVYRVFITPAVAEAKVEGNVAVENLGHAVQDALSGAAPLNLTTVLAALPDDAILKVVKAQAPLPTDVPQENAKFTGDANQPVPPAV